MLRRWQPTRAARGCVRPLLARRSLLIGSISSSFRIIRWGIVAAIFVAAILVTYIARRSPAEAAGGARHDTPWLDGHRIRFSPEFAERSKIVVSPIERGSLAPIVSVTGTVSFDPERVAAVGARIPGRIRTIFKLPGDSVERGDAIVDIESATLGEAQAALIAARARADAAAKNATRESQLVEARVSAVRDAELAQANAVAAKADLLAAEQRVKALGGAGNGEIGILVLHSPISGRVIEMEAARGQSVESTMTVARVADLRRVWIELAVFERDLSRISTGDRVEISPQTNTAQVVNGTVAHVGDIIDLDTRSAPVRVVVQNDDRALRPGQSVLAKIHVAPGGDAMLLPRDAVVSIDGKSTVFVAQDATSVEPRVVALGGGDGAHVEVASGLDPTERVVVGGVFALKSEVFR